MAKRVLIIGEIPENVDFQDPSIPPGMTAEKVHAGLDAAASTLRSRGYDAEQCLIDPDESGAATITERLRAQRYDGIVVGAGIRIVSANLMIFEKLINICRAEAPGTRIMFNSKPDDTAEAVMRGFA